MIMNDIGCVIRSSKYLRRENYARVDDYLNKCESEFIGAYEHNCSYKIGHRDNIRSMTVHITKFHGLTFLAECEIEELYIEGECSKSIACDHIIIENLPNLKILFISNIYVKKIACGILPAIDVKFIKISADILQYPECFEDRLKFTKCSIKSLSIPSLVNLYKINIQENNVRGIQDLRLGKNYPSITRLSIYSRYINDLNRYENIKLVLNDMNLRADKLKRIAINGIYCDLMSIDAELLEGITLTNSNIYTVIVNSSMFNHIETKNTVFSNIIFNRNMLMDSISCINAKYLDICNAPNLTYIHAANLRVLKLQNCNIPKLNVLLLGGCKIENIMFLQGLKLRHLTLNVDVINTWNYVKYIDSNIIVLRGESRAKLTKFISLCCSREVFCTRYYLSALLYTGVRRLNKHMIHRFLK